MEQFKELITEYLQHAHIEKGLYFSICSIRQPYFIGYIRGPPHREYLNVWRAGVTCEISHIRSNDRQDVYILQDWPSADDILDYVSFSVAQVLLWKEGDVIKRHTFIPLLEIREEEPTPITKFEWPTHPWLIPD